MSPRLKQTDGATPNAFGNPLFLRLWITTLMSGTAVAAHDTAATWMMNLMSPSGLFISLMASVAALPFFLFTLPAGAFADALNEGRILRLANLWLAGSAGMLALLGWAGKLTPVFLLMGVFLLGAGFAINAPAWASIIPQIVTDAELPSASALNGIQLNISAILGPALAGILLTKVGAPVVFALNAAGFLLVSTAVPSVPKLGLGLGPALKTFAASVSSAFLYIGRTQSVHNIIIRNAIFSCSIVVVPALTPVLLLKELSLDGSSLGLVFASLGAGSVIGAVFLIPWLRSRFSSGALLASSQIVLAGIYLLMAAVHHCIYCLIPMALAGAAWTLAASELWVLAQRAVPNSLRGRVSAIFMVTSQGVSAVGGLIWGLSGQILGSRLTLIAAGVFVFSTTTGPLLLGLSKKSLSITGKRKAPSLPQLDPGTPLTRTGIVYDGAMRGHLGRRIGF
jgi:transmembrane secretion effector